MKRSDYLALLLFLIVLALGGWAIGYALSEIVRALGAGI